MLCHISYLPIIYPFIFVFCCALCPKHILIRCSKQLSFKSLKQSSDTRIFNIFVFIRPWFKIFSIFCFIWNQNFSKSFFGLSILKFGILNFRFYLNFFRLLNSCSCLAEVLSWSFNCFICSFSWLFGFFLLSFSLIRLILYHLRISYGSFFFSISHYFIQINLNIN